MSFLRNGKERDMVPCLICSVGQSKSTRDIHMAECAKIFHISKTNLKKIIEREEPKKNGKSSITIVKRGRPASSTETFSFTRSG